jgi:hypothetical protein
MTISSTSIKNSYSGNGSTATFNYTFKIFANSDLQVIIRSSSGTETVKTITTHYTVAGAGNSSGGSITFTSGNIPTNTETVVIRRNLPQTQTIDYIANDPFPAESHEEGLDRAMMTIQQIQEELDRSIKVSRTTSITTPEITDDATARAGKLLGFDSTGNVLDATIDGSGVAVSATNAANSATAAANSASAAATSATAAENAKNAAEAALDTFDDDFLGAKSSNPSVDNDGNALADGALYFDTTNNVMKVYDLGNTQWKQLTPTTSQQSNIDAAVANASNINAVGGNISNVNTVAGNNTNINTVASNNTNINTVAGISSNVTTVAGAVSAINTANSNASNINTVAGAITNVNNVGGSITNVNSVASNLSSVNSFANTYRIASSAPTTSLDVGDLYFDTTQNELKVYKSSGWSAAGSSVNGTSARFKFNITGTPTTLSGNDANGVALSYDAGFIDVYLNGVKQVNGTDVTVSSGNSIVFASALANGDIVEAVAFGTFNVAAINAANINSGTLNNDRLPSPTLIVKGDGSSVDGAIQLNCHVNTHGVKIKAPPHSAGQSYTLILPQNTGSNGQVLASNGSSTNQLSWIDATETKPTVADVSQTIAPATATTITITGTNFVSIPQVEFIKTDGSVTVANTVSFTSATSLQVNVTLASGNYFVRIENPDGNAGRSTNNIITASTAPSFSTAAGSLGTIAGNFSGTVATVAGSSDSSITFSEVTSVLTNASQANCSLASNGVITTSDFGGSSTTPTTYNFTLRITDAEGQTVDRAFSLTSSFGATGGGQFN